MAEPLQKENFHTYLKMYENDNNNIELINKILSSLKDMSNLPEEIIHGRYEYLKKEIENNLEKIKILDENLKSVVIKLIEEKKYNKAIDLFRTERSKIINMQNPNSWETFKKEVIKGVGFGIGFVGGIKFLNFICNKLFNKSNNSNNNDSNAS